MKFLAVLQLVAGILLLQGIQTAAKMTCIQAETAYSDRVQQLEAYDHDDDHHGSYHHHHDDDHHDQRGMSVCGCRGGRRGGDDDKASCVYNGVTRAHRSQFLAEDGCNNWYVCSRSDEATVERCVFFLQYLL